MTYPQLRAELGKLPAGTLVTVSSWKNPEGKGRLYEYTAHKGEESVEGR